MENVDTLKGISSPCVYPQKLCHMHYSENLAAL